ncbi:hypothetical protein ABIB25_003487 [Nakamurella sp. UYEF19]|uniref:hypothetical protein n=1 Tax=Nakamurella sp. UYEF19 TaxID=1756392 RepID=UPI003392CA00
MIEWERYQVDRRYFTATGKHGVIERFPTICPNGHPLGPDTMLVAAHPCLCISHGHRIWRCWTCDAVWTRPPCSRHPEWTPWSG